MDCLDAGRPACELTRVDRGDAARERLSIGPCDLDAVTGSERPFDSRYSDGKEAASVTDDGTFRPGIDHDPTRDTFAVTQP